MSTSYPAKGENQLSQQLKVQELNLVIPAAQANSASAIDLTLVSLTGAAATRAVAVKIDEPVQQIISYVVRNQNTGGVVALLSAPSIVSSTRISATLDATVAVPLVVTVKYIVVD